MAYLNLTNNKFHYIIGRVYRDDGLCTKLNMYCVGGIILVLYGEEI